MHRRALLVGLSTTLAGCSLGGVGAPQIPGESGTEGTPTPTAADRAFVADREIAPAPGCSDAGPRGSASIEFERRGGSVRVSGCIVGETTCAEPRLREASHDPDANDLNVVITAPPDPQPGRECREEASPVGYVARVQFDPGIPSGLSVRVEHRGARAGEIATARL